MKFLKILGIIIFIIGFLIGMIFIGFTVWADFESTLFSAAESGDAGLRSLRCPALINQTETGLIHATVTNSLDREATHRIDAFFSDGFVTLIRTQRDLFKLPPGENRSLQWEVDSSDAAYDLVVMARIIAKGGYPSPERHGTCGILVVPVSFISGNQVLIATISSSLGFLAIGLVLWNRGSHPLKGNSMKAFRAMVALVVFIVAGILTTIMGWWFLGALIFIISILLIGGIIAYFITD